MKHFIFIILAAFTFLTSCSNDDEIAQEREEAKLEKMYNEIIAMSLADSQVSLFVHYFL
jgi:outer membrane protein assembly factor BamD (BamD/ComL family)